MNEPLSEIMQQTGNGAHPAKPFNLQACLQANLLHFNFLCEIQLDHPVEETSLSAQPKRAARGLNAGAAFEPGPPPMPPGATVLVTYSVTLVLTMVVEVRCVMVGVLRNVILISFVIVLGITVSFTTASLVTKPWVRFRQFNESFLFDIQRKCCI